MAGCGAGSFSSRGVASKRVVDGRTKKGGVKAAPLRWGYSVAAVGASTFVSATTPGAASSSRSVRSNNRRRGERGLGLVTDAVAVNRSQASVDEMDPEHVTFASQDELDHR